MLLSLYSKGYIQERNLMVPSALTGRLYVKTLGVQMVCTDPGGGIYLEWTNQGCQVILPYVI